MTPISAVFYSADGGLYGTARAFCFWNALLPLTNLARASMPVLYRGSLRACGMRLLRRLCDSALCGFRSRIVCVRVFGVLRRMGNRWARVYYVFGGIR